MSGTLTDAIREALDEWWSDANPDTHEHHIVSTAVRAWLAERLGADNTRDAVKWAINAVEWVEDADDVEVSGYEEPHRRLQPGHYLPLITQRLHRRLDPVQAVRASGDDGGLFDLLDEGTD